MTTDQLSSAKYLAHFASCLFKSKMTERSNSVRARLFRVFYDAIAWHRREIPEYKYLVDLLRQTGPFDRDEIRFRGAIKVGLQLIGRSPDLSEIAGTIRRFAVEAHTERTFEFLADALRREGEDKKQDAKLSILVKAVLAENEINDFFDSLTPKSKEREAAAKMVDKAIDQAVAEFREKFGALAST